MKRGVVRYEEISYEIFIFLIAIMLETQTKEEIISANQTSPDLHEKLHIHCRLMQATKFLILVHNGNSYHCAHTKTDPSELSKIRPFKIFLNIVDTFQFKHCCYLGLYFNY